MFRFGMGELLVIFLIILLLFGAKRLPEIAQALGKSLKEFKKATKDVKKTFDEAAHSDEDDEKKTDV
jgi:TatA/E family protein of Tat protein translocase